MRQTIENFNLELTTSEILRLLTDFSKCWKAYKERFKVMGDRLDAAKKECDTSVTTWTNMLDRSLKKIEGLGKSDASVIAVRDIIEDEV